MMVEKELEFQLNNAGAETIITLGIFYPAVKKVVPRTQIKRVIIASLADIFPPLLSAVRPPQGKEEFPGPFDFSALLKSHGPKAPEVKIEPKKDLAHLAYTGGTTGVSNGVMLTHFNVTANVLYGAQWWAGGDLSFTDGILNVVREEGDQEEDHTVNFGRGKMLIVAPYKKIRQVIFKKQLPVSGAGKVLKKELRKELM